MNIKKLYGKYKKKLFNFFIPFKIRYFYKPTKGKPHHLDKELVISLTSYRARFKTLPLTLKCLLNQTVQPDQIILWIGFEDKEYVTDEINKLTQYGLSIKFHENLRSFTKIIPTLEENLDRYVITADDDLYYPETLVEDLLIGALKHPNAVIANRTHRITLDENGLPRKYSEWEKRGYDNNHPELNFLTGVGGVLYPPHILYKDVLNTGIFKELCPTNDDLWLYWMIRLNNNFVYHSETKFAIFTWPSSQKTALIHMHNKDANDKQVIKLIDYYGFIR